MGKVRHSGFLLFISALLLNADGFLGPYAPARIHDHLDNWLVGVKSIGQEFCKHGLHAWDPSNVCGHSVISYGLHLCNPVIWMAAILPLWLVTSLLSVTLIFLAGW